MVLHLLVVVLMWADEPWTIRRPEGERFVSGMKFHRPNWGIWKLWFFTPSNCLAVVVKLMERRRNV